MRILQVAKKFPFPPKDGESLAIVNLARGLADEGCEVSLLAMNTHKHWSDFEGGVPAEFDFYQNVHTVAVDNRIKPLAALGNLFSEKSYHIQRFENEAFAQKMAAVLRGQTFDVVQLETLYLAPYLPVIRENSKAKIVLRAHNVEHEIWERITAGSGWLKRWYLQKITPRLRQFEVENLNRYDLLLPISERDEARFRDLGFAGKSAVVPIGLDCSAYRPDASSFRRPLSLGFIGSLDWMPNLEGLQWFLREIWVPHVAPRFPDLTLNIAGRNTPAWLQNLNLRNVHILGEVPSAADFINQHSVMVVPLLSGSGMRAKILEGMALGKVVLATRMGMEGIAAENHGQALLADTAEEFVAALDWCQNAGAGLQSLGASAQNFCAEHFDNQAIARNLLEVYRGQREFFLAAGVEVGGGRLPLPHV